MDSVSIDQGHRPSRAKPGFMETMSYLTYRLLSSLHRAGLQFIILLVVAVYLVVVFNLIADTSRKPRVLPDMFNSVGMTINHSPFDAKWQRAAVPGHSAAWTGLTTKLRAINDPMERLRFVQQAVNHGVVYGEDRATHRVDDAWAKPDETLALRRGDCEDFAILKMMLLNAAGVPMSDMYLTVGYDMLARSDHAVLTVKAAGAMWTLDQRTDVVQRANAVTEFRPVMTLSENNSWLHGTMRQGSSLTGLQTAAAVK